MIERLARVCAAHPWRTIGTWLAAVVLAAAAAAFLFAELTTEGRPTNNPDSQRAAAALRQAFPPNPNAIVTDVMIVRSDRYTVEQPAFRTFVERLVADARRTNVVGGDQNYYSTRDRSLVSRDGHALVVPIFITDTDSAGSVVDVVDRADADADFLVAITGDQTMDNDVNELSQSDLENGELRFGAPAALVVLLLVFGSVVAGLIPLLIAILSIVVAVGLVALFSQAFELSVFFINMLSGMGLALGIDYSLFILSRYREERARGLAQHDAIAASGATASRAVFFSGTAFVVAMLGMLIVPNNIMRSLALGAILVGIVSVVAALTLLPALLGLLGDRINALRIPLVGRASGEARFWHAVVERVLRRPAVSLAVAGGSGDSGLRSRHRDERGLDAAGPARLEARVHRAPAQLSGCHDRSGGGRRRRGIRPGGAGSALTTSRPARGGSPLRPRRDSGGARGERRRARSPGARRLGREPCGCGGA